MNRCRESRGYVRITVEPGKRVYEHRYIAEQVIGRPLKTKEEVHHINGDNFDNRKCNLLICSNIYHSWLHKRMQYLYMQEKFTS